MPNILSICSHPEIRRVMNRLIDAHDSDWNSIAVPNLEQGLQVLSEQSIDVILLGAGTGAEEKQILRAHFERTGVKIPVAEHYGGGSGLIFAEIYQALDGDTGDHGGNTE